MDSWREKINIDLPSPIMEIDLSHFIDTNVRLYVKREDLIHPLYGGNKWRKLRGAIDEYSRQSYSGLITFGGAFSNHLAATAALCHELAIPCTIYVRGDHIDTDNPTLRNALELGACIKMMDRRKYRQRNEPDFLTKIKEDNPMMMIVPEGGSGSYAAVGIKEMVKELEVQLDFVPSHLCISSGTGMTAGIICNQITQDLEVHIFSALKGQFLGDEIKKLTSREFVFYEDDNGGYGKTTAGLIKFINDFSTYTGVPLDPIYNGKMMYRLVRMISRGTLDVDAKILAVHTGGLQGIQGYNYLYPNSIIK